MAGGQNTHNTYWFQHHKWLTKFKQPVLTVGILGLESYALDVNQKESQLGVEDVLSAIIVGIPFNTQKYRF